MEQTPEIIQKLEAKADRLKKSAFTKKPQPLSPFGSEYVGFQSRMWAATVDSMVLLVTIIPVSMLLTNLVIGQVDTSMTPLFIALDGVMDPYERGRIMREFLFADEKMRYLEVNTLIQLVGIFAYCMWFWKKYGATPGKMLTKQKLVILKTGDYLNYEQGVWRCLGYIVSIAPLFLGIVWLSFDRKRQGWHDKIVGSVVISSKKRKEEDNNKPII